MSGLEEEFILGSDQIVPMGLSKRLRLLAARIHVRTGDFVRAVNPFRNALSAAPEIGGFFRPYDSASGAGTPTRTIMVAALTMPAVFIVVVMASIAVFGRPAAPATPAAHHVRANERLEQPPRGAVTATNASTQAEAFVAAPIDIGADAHIASMSLDGDRIAVLVESADGARIVVYDLTRGRTIAAAPIRTSSLAGGDFLTMVAPVNASSEE